MLREIGSEYWQIDIDKNHINNNLFNIGKDTKFLMSGRTAIDYVLKNIEDDKKVVYMPNYCCETMVKPFIDNDYQVKYYNIDLIRNKCEININENCSIFFAMSYFGYQDSNIDNFIKEFHKRDIIIIEDITHRLFQKKNYSEYSDYLIASLRKWVPIYDGAIAVNLNAKFLRKIDDYVINYKLISQKKKAMQLKAEYINKKINDKKEYLNLFNSSDVLFEDYRNKKIDDESFEILKHYDFRKMIDQRIKNAKLIEEKMEKNSKVKLIYKIKDGDCPLFVPVVIDNRNQIRNKLIQNNIYLPIHWPNTMNLQNDIYNNEISLVCDQRYDETEIKDYIDKFINIING